MDNAFAPSLRTAMMACALAIATIACSPPGGSADNASSGSKAATALDPVLADPKVGDLYAAELTHFSGARFSDENGKGSDEPAYGLMKVIEVTPDQIVLRTEMESWPRPRGAINDLRGDQSDIEWDDEEEIRILRKELAQLVAGDKIMEVRRPGT